MLRWKAVIPGLLLFSGMVFGPSNPVVASSHRSHRTVRRHRVTAQYRTTVTHRAAPRWRPTGRFSTRTSRGSQPRHRVVTLGAYTTGSRTYASQVGVRTRTLPGRYGTRQYGNGDAAAYGPGYAPGNLPRGGFYRDNGLAHGSQPYSRQDKYGNW